MRHRYVIIAGLLGLSQAVSAQELRGSVSDSATGQAIAGAVVMLLDPVGATLARSISNERGQYRLAASPSMRRLRIVRLGFRARDIPLGTISGVVMQLDLKMVAIPALLEPVYVTAAAHCPRRRDRTAALALLEQARAGLLTTVVARETNLASMLRLRFERTMDRTSERIEHQVVRHDSSAGVARSFEAAQSARDFVRSGFLRDIGDTRIFLGPDAEVLLDDAFAGGYCFHLRDPSRERPNQVGLAFQPARRRRGRVDIDGTLWIDTVARALRDVEFRYLGLEPAAEIVRPGGRVSFWEMANGVVFIDRWYVQLPSVSYDTSYGRSRRPFVRYFGRQSGGEVATAVWPDGHSYQAPLGVLSARAVDIHGKPVTGLVVRLSDTDYLASPDSLGFFEISNLVPGPYVALVIYPELARLGISLPTPLRFTAIRDSVVHQQMLVPEMDEYVRLPCGGGSLTAEEAPLLRARVMTPDSKPVSGVRWQLSKDNGVLWQRVTETRTTGADGRIHSCLKLKAGDQVELRVWRGAEQAQIKELTVGRDASVTITLPAAR